MPASLKVMGTEKGTLTDFPSTLPGVSFGINEIILFASVSRIGSGPLALICSTYPPVPIIN